MVEIVRSYNHRIKGKLNHFQKDDFFRLGLGDYYWQPKDKVNIEELKLKLIEVMKQEGFVFFDNIEYKAKFKFGCLYEFAIQYHHIL